VEDRRSADGRAFRRRGEKKPLNTINTAKVIGFQSDRCVYVFTDLMSSRDLDSLDRAQEFLLTAGGPRHPLLHSRRKQAREAQGAGGDRCREDRHPGARLHTLLWLQMAA